MENNFLGGGVAELEQVKVQLIDEADKNAAVTDAELAVKTKEKDLETQKKYMAEKISNATKERRGDLKKAQDEQVDAATKVLKDAEKKRREAKASAVNERVHNETASLTDKIEATKKEINAMFKEKGVPSFCNSFYYYSMFAPKTGKNFIAFIITIVIALGIIPNAVCLLVKPGQWLLKVLVYLAVVVFFAAIYFIIFISTHSKGKGEVIEAARAKRNIIEASQKEIKKITKGIRSDKDESLYDLQSFDEEINQAQTIVDEKSKAREEALRVFDEETAVQIKNEIEKENLPAIEQMETELNGMRADLEVKRAAVKAISDTLANNYSAYLGKKNMSTEKIDAMISLIQEGKAKTIMQAMDLLNGEMK
ncbi:MAG: hypothetical protein MJ092_07340 [Lachnospiraceae bacterium]|nr:hypothetical protein [Lachnospiraceae bacterium]